MLARVGAVTVSDVLKPPQVSVVVPTASAVTELPLTTAIFELLLVQVPSAALVGLGEILVLLPMVTAD